MESSEERSAFSRNALKTWVEGVDRKLVNSDLCQLGPRKLEVPKTRPLCETNSASYSGTNSAPTKITDTNWAPFHISFLCRRGYLGSTLLACRAVAPPHIKLEICIKHIFHTNMYTQLFPQLFCHIFFNKQSTCKHS